MRLASHYVHLLWAFNVPLLVLVGVAGLLVDGNGRLPGLNEGGSVIAAAILLALGLATDGLLILLDRKRRVLAIGVAAVYASLFLPLLL